MKIAKKSNPISRKAAMNAKVKARSFADLTRVVEKRRASLLLRPSQRKA